MGQVMFSRRVSAYGRCLGIYLVSVSLCTRILVYLAWNTIRSETSQHPIEIHSMDHLASLTSLSHFLPITYVTFRRKVQPFFSQFEYIVPSADIHMYTRPILCLPLSRTEAFLPGFSLLLSLSLSLLYSAISVSYPRFTLAHISQFLPG